MSVLSLHPAGAVIFGLFSVSDCVGKRTLFIRKDESGYYKYYFLLEGNFIRFLKSFFILKYI